MIYIHIPFCRSFCTYCDFYSEIAAKCRGKEDVLRQEDMFDKFADALVREIRLRADEITDEVNTLYIGGGTPSVLPLYVYKRVLEELKSLGHGAPFDEFTVEVNPEDIVDKGPDYVEGLLKLGVNRISMGVQSFDDGVLKFMNRRHDAHTARKAYAVLEEAGVGNISIDLIFGLPQLSDSQWQETLDKALSISSSGNLPQHISSYQLSVEPGSILAKLVDRGKWSEASEELCERQYGVLCEALRKAGYRHYEISNFALPGFEAKHNSAYWKHIPYVGLGPGAHSFVADSRSWNEPDLQRYIDSPLSVRDGETLTQDQMVLERIMLALRTSDGIDEDFLCMHCDSRRLKHAIGSGDLLRIVSESEVNAISGRIRIPEDRFFVSDSIIAGLV